MCAAQCPKLHALEINNLSHLLTTLPDIEGSVENFKMRSLICSRFKAEVDNFMDRKIECLQSDNGLEYCNRKFDNLLKENGITRRLSASNTQHQNAERKN